MSEFRGAASQFSVGEIKRMLQQRCPGLIHELVPGCRREGTVLSAPNPTRANDKPGSFKIWPNGAWREYDEADDVGKGDILNLIAYVHDHPPKSTEGRRFALEWARKYLGLSEMTPAQRGAARRSASKAAEQKRLRAERDEAQRRWRHRMKAREILHGAVPIHAEIDDPVVSYLAARGVDLGAIADLTPGILRHHRRLAHWTGDRGLYPAMVAAVVMPDLPDRPGGLTAVHCTFLAPPDENGILRPAKADVDPAKLMLGTVKGAIVPLTLGPGRLTVREALACGARCPVVLCEGIETGLSLALATEGQARVWACLSLGNIGAAPVALPCVSAVIVAIENDTKPQAVRQRDSVLEQLEAACAPLAIPVSIMAPDAGAVDFNDMISTIN